MALMRTIHTRSAAGYGIALSRPVDGRPYYGRHEAVLTLTLRVGNCYRQAEGLTFEEAEAEADRFMAACHAWKAQMCRVATLAQGFAMIGDF